MPNDSDLLAGPRTEHEFWNSEPRYSEPPRTPLSLPAPPAPRPSRLRVVMARLLFFVLFSAAFGLLGYEVARKYNLPVPWLDGLLNRSGLAAPNPR